MSEILKSEVDVKSLERGLLKGHPVVLEGRRVKLEPLADRHIEALLAIAYEHSDEYRLTSTPANPEQAERYFRTAFEERAGGRAYPFAILDKPSQKVIGSSRLADYRAAHRNCELGYTWFDPAYFRSGVNTECKYLMLQHCFESLELLRVQIHTDTRNLRSQRAIRALGAVYEGVLRAHMLSKDGHIRDTMVFSITYKDWPDIRLRLEERLAAASSG